MLTSAQLTTLAADVNGQASLAAARAAADWPAVAAFYNAPSNPVVTIWRKDVAPAEVVANIVMSEFVGLTAVKQQGLILLLTPATIDASSSNVQAAFSSIFAAGTTLNNLAALAKRTATRLEALFSTGSPTAVSQLYGYVLGADEVQKAMLL